MNLFIPGATGRTGSEAVGQALERGRRVTAFVRSPEKIAHRHGRLRVVTGDLRQADRLVPTLDGHDAILSALGPRSLGRTTLLADCARSALAAMGTARLRRLLVVFTRCTSPTARRPQNADPLGPGERRRGHVARLRASRWCALAAGKARMAAVGACMRKLLMIAYGVLKSRTRFDPNWGSKMAP